MLNSTTLGYLLGAVGLLGSLTTQAQSRAAISGVLSSPAGAPVEFATVTLHRAADSAVVKTEFSDEKGAFRLEAVSGARYLVSAAQVGYGRYWSGPLDLPAAGLSLPPIALQTSAATALKEVTVTARRPLYERQADRTVVNVEGSTLAAGATTLDILGRSPGVTVDGNDNLALRGRQGLLVLIDGKRQPMTGAELADYLRALPAEQLKSIELITNPPAKYDAQGSAGIIAINLRKDQRLGTNGSASLSLGHGQYRKLNGGLTLNHRRKDLNLFGSLNVADRRGFQALTIHRDFLLAGRIVGSSDQDNRLLVHSRSQSWKAGADYNLGKNTVLGVSLNGLMSNTPQSGTNTTVLYDQPGDVVKGRYRSPNTRDDQSPNVAGNLNFKHTFTDSLGRKELTADLDYARYETDRKQGLNIMYDLPARRDSLVNNVQKGLLTIQSVKLDYVMPLSKIMTLEAGLKSSLVTSDNDVKFTNTVEGITRPDPNQSNRFRYDENINAAYLTLNRNSPGLSLSGGLRVEQTNAEGRPENLSEGFTRNYFQLFPSAGIQKKLSANHELALSLSRRIDRPGYRQLNPFRIWIDATTYGSGNPDLRPQTSYNVEMTHTFREKFSTGLSYSVTSDPMVGVVQPENASSRFVVSREINLGRQYNYALTFTAPLEPAKWWNVYNNVVVYYAHFVGELAGTALDRGRPAFNLSSNSTFTFGKGWGADLNASYQSRQVYGFFDIQPQGGLTAGIQKNAWGKKVNFKLNVSDVFYTQVTRATSSYNNYVERFYQRGDSRVGTFSVTYRFGNDKLAPTRRRSGGAEEEKRRAG